MTRWMSFPLAVLALVVGTSCGDSNHGYTVAIDGGGHPSPDVAEAYSAVVRDSLASDSQANVCDELEAKHNVLWTVDLVGGTDNPVDTEEGCDVELVFPQVGEYVVVVDVNYDDGASLYNWKFETVE